MKKQQEHILWTLETKEIAHEIVDIADPSRDQDRRALREHGKTVRARGRVPLPPQIFKDENFLAVRMHFIYPRSFL